MRTNFCRLITGLFCALLFSPAFGQMLPMLRQQQGIQLGPHLLYCEGTVPTLEFNWSAPADHAGQPGLVFFNLTSPGRDVISFWDGAAWHEYHHEGAVPVNVGQTRVAIPPGMQYVLPFPGMNTGPYQNWEVYTASGVVTDDMLKMAAQRRAVLEHAAELRPEVADRYTKNSQTDEEYVAHLIVHRIVTNNQWQLEFRIPFLDCCPPEVCMAAGAGG